MEIRGSDIIDMSQVPTGRTRRPMSEETKKLLSEKKKGFKHPKFSGLYVTPAGKFVTPAEAAAKLGISPRTVIRRCKRDKSKAGWNEPGYSFEPITANLKAIQASISSFTTPDPILQTEQAQKVYKEKVDKIKVKVKDVSPPREHGVSYRRSLPKSAPGITFEEYMKMEEEGLI